MKKKYKENYNFMYLVKLWHVHYKHNIQDNFKSNWRFVLLINPEIVIY